MFVSVNSCLDFLLAKDFAECAVAFGAIVERDFELHAFALFVRSSCHLPGLLRLCGIGSTFWTFSHSISSMMLLVPWFP